MRKRYSDEDLEKVLGKSDFADLMKAWRFELPFEDIYENENEKWHDASKYSIKDITDRVPWQFTFKYDYGDGWRVNLTLESCEKIEIHAGELPRVLEGEGFGIIEDCGGVGGLEELAKAFKKKNGRQYDEYREWLGTDDLDLSVFDIDDINFRLKKLPRIYKECYEYGYEPTQRSIDLIERKHKKMTDYILTRSKRKTIAIHVTKDAAVEVRAPMKASEVEIDRFVTSRQGWLISICPHGNNACNILRA